MNHRTKVMLVSAVAVLMCAAAYARSDDAPELQLTPCAIELVDGTQVAGRLAVQFDMPDHLIVYSPRFATVRSFLKDHVHALTVGGKREELNRKRELTEDDKTLLGGTDWPETPPAKGPKPAYCTETWEKPRRLLVWARPGIKDLRADNPSNWLLNGRPVEAFEYTQRQPFVIDAESGKKKEVSSLFDTETDILIPASDNSYRIVYSSERENIALQCRHLTTDVNALFRPRNLSRMAGNLWNRGGRGCMSGRKWIRFSGDKHTFIINNVDHPGLAPEPVGSGLSYLQTIFAHEVYFDKGEGSVHLLGPLAAKYHMQAISGTTIVGSGAMLMYASDTPFVVEPDATVELRSGGIVAYRGASRWGKEENDYRMILRGTLKGGSAEFPLTSDCYLGVPTFEHPAEGVLPRLIFAEGATVKVHTSDAEAARLVVTNDRRDKGEHIAIVVNDADGLHLDGVLFDHVREGGIMLADMTMRRAWKAASFGEHNAAGPDELFASIPKHLVQGQWLYPQDAPVPEIAPVPRVHVKGRDTVRVTLSAEAAADGCMRYTLDGTVPDVGDQVYEGPIALNETTVVRARCFKDSQRLGPPARAHYVFEAPRALKPGKPDMIEQGLNVAHFGKASRYTSYGVFENAPVRTGAVEQVDLSFTKGQPAALRFTGYLRIRKAGVYEFEAVTDRASDDRGFARMRLAGRPIFQHASYRVAADDVRLSGVARLEAGMYPLKLHTLAEGSRLKLLWKGPGFDRQAIPAEVLHQPQRWNAVIMPGGGLRKDGKPLAVRMSVETRAATDGVTVHYTQDGSEPTAGSAAYAKPITVTEDITVRARCFRDGKPLPGKVATAQFLFLSGLDDAKPGLVYRAYEGGWSTLPDFDKLDPAVSGVTERFGLGAIERDSRFALVFNGYLKVATPGQYTFYTTSDDGSALYINDKRIVNNDGAHGMQERHGTVTLSEGPHLIRVEYFQGGGGKGLEVHWNGPGVDKQPIPADVLSH
ncbi:MAG: chitobiase/beta-hexosaminidase C-terminal domain-containing protein [Phycisphaerae bacterium]|nr:chitobiase/beta-hexosaminidase C-terminal domain-containing protein [Phycisphaerae bacterium]